MPGLMDILWAVEPVAFGHVIRQAKEPVAGAMPEVHAEAQAAGAGRDDYEMVGTTAVISLRGMLAKSIPWWMGGTSTVRAKAAIQAAAANPVVRNILLRIDSPGGTVAGTRELAEAVWKARQEKTVIAYIEDLGASAAYWVASQADEIHMNPTGMAGSIGTLMVIHDLSAFYGEQGIKTHVISTGQFKGAGVIGSEITEAHVKSWQTNIDNMNDHFLAGVARGRAMSIDRVREIADGQVHVGEAALKLGLINSLQSIEETLDGLAQAGGLSSAARSETHGDAEMKFNQAQIELMRSFGLAEDATDAQSLEFYKTMNAQQQLEIATANVQEATGDAAPKPVGAAAVPPAAEPAASNEPPAPNVSDAVQSALQVDRSRVAAITVLAADSVLGDAWSARHIALGTSEAAAKTLAEEISGVMKDNKPVSGIEVGADLNRESLPNAIQDAILLRTNTSLIEFDEDDAPKSADGKFVTRQAHGRTREFLGRSLVEMGERWINAMGVSTAGMQKPQIARLLMNRQKLQQAVMAAGGTHLGHTTSDFGDILAAVPNKTLRQGYAEWAGNWNRWARANANVPDFRPVNRKSLSALTTPPIVREGAEYTYVSASDSGETYTLAKYGQIFALTWETLINDDLDAFARLPLMHGAACARLEDDLAYAQLTSNPTMGDGVVLFHANHANLTASGTALSVVSLGVARASMRKQTGLAGEKIDIRPSVLLVPAELETAAQQLVTSLVDPTKSNATPNPFSGLLEVVAQPRLDDNSTTAWYLVAPTVQVDTVEVGFLAGHRMPHLEEEAGFMVDGRQYKARHVVAARAIDHRGFYKNPGA